MPVIYGAVGAPSTISAADGTNLPLLQDKFGAAEVAGLNDWGYTWAYRGWGFVGSTLPAGLTITAFNSTAMVFGLFNPAGNARNAVPQSIDIGYYSSTATVVTNYALAYTTSIGAAPATGGNVSAATFISPVNQLLAGGNTNTTRFVQSTATVVSAATSYLMTLGYGYTSTAPLSSPATIAHYEFRGRLIVPPNVALWLVGSSTATTGAVVDATVTWYEPPV